MKQKLQVFFPSYQSPEDTLVAEWPKLKKSDRIAGVTDRHDFREVLDMNQHQTYTTFEVLERLPLLDASSLIEMRSLIEEEAHSYSLLEKELIFACLAAFVKTACEEDILKKETGALQATFFLYTKIPLR